MPKLKIKKVLVYRTRLKWIKQVKDMEWLKEPINLSEMLRDYNLSKSDEKSLKETFKNIILGDGKKKR